MNCSCGAKSVSSHMHSHWCDTLRSRSAFDAMYSEICKDLAVAFYICTGKSNPLTVYDAFRRHTTQAWGYTSEGNGVYRLYYPNGAEAVFLHDDNELEAPGEAARFIEYTDSRTRPRQLGSSTTIVDPHTWEIL